MDTLRTLIPIILPIVGGVIGYWIKHLVDKKKELLSEISRERREHYQKFVDLIVDLFANTKTGKKMREDEWMKKLFEFYKKYILYASPGVINSFSDYFQYLYRQEKPLDSIAHITLLTKVMLEMRKDLGLNNKNLGKNGERLFRGLITDFDNTFPE